MIRLNVKLILKNKKFLTSCILIMLLGIFVFLYQEKNQKYEGVQYSNFLKDLQSGKITENDIYDSSYTENSYYEYLLREKVSEYVYLSTNYNEVLNQILNNEQVVLNSKNSSGLQKIKSKLMLEKYSAIKDIDVKMGNYSAFEKFFKVDVSDYLVILIIFLCIYFLVIYEKEKSLSKLIASTRNGGRLYFVKKVVAVFIVGSIFTIIAMGIKLLLCISMYGMADMSASIQSMNEFIKSPFDISISTYLVLFIIYRIVLVLVFSIIVISISSLPIKSGTISALLVFGAIVLLMMDNFIESSSGLVLLRDVGLFRLFDLNYFAQGYRIYSLIEFGQTAIFFCGMTLPIAGICILIVAFSLIGLQCYHRGIKNLGKSKSTAAFIKYNSGVVGNEIKNLMFRQKALIIMLVIVIGGVFFMFDFDENRNANIVYEREMVKKLNGLSQEEGKVFIEEKYQEMQAYRNQLAEAEVLLAEGKITQSSYENIYATLSMQLAYYYIVEDLYIQSIDIEQYNDSHDTKISYEFKSLSEELFGISGLNDRIMIAFFISIFLIVSCSTIFPKEKERQAEKLLQSASLGEKSFNVKVIISVVNTMLIAGIIHAIWAYSLMCRFEFVGRSSAMRSVFVYRNLQMNFSFMTGLIVEIILQSLKWGMMALIVIFISLLFKSIFTSEIMSIVLLAIPLGLELVGVAVKNILPYTRYMVFGKSIIVNIWENVLLILLIAALALLNRKGIRKWKMH